jgi:broad specificity phosphatase PhoE
MTIFLIRHSYCFDFSAFENVENWHWDDFNKNMLLTAEGEDLARKLGEMAELGNVDAVFSANSTRAIGTAKYIARKNNIKIDVQNEINERAFANNFLIRDIKKNENLYTETEKQVQARFQKWIDGVASRTEYKRVAVVLHAKILIIYLKSLGFDLSFNMHGYLLKHGTQTICDEAVIGNPLLLKLEFENGKFQSLENIKLDFALTGHLRANS